jgi:hypothetical protein
LIGLLYLFFGVKMSFSEPTVELLIQNDKEHAVFMYLFELQESGETNMFGAAAYIIRQPQFSEISLIEAETLVNKWMNNYESIKTELAPDTIQMK